MDIWTDEFKKKYIKKLSKCGWGVRNSILIVIHFNNVILKSPLNLFILKKFCKKKKKKSGFTCPIQIWLSFGIK